MKFFTQIKFNIKFHKKNIKLMICNNYFKLKN